MARMPGYEKKNIETFIGCIDSIYSIVEKEKIRFINDFIKLQSRWKIFQNKECARMTTNTNKI